MDSNYEAQKQLTRQRLDARRQQAQVERLSREGRPVRTGGLKHFLVTLFLRPARREEKKRAQHFRSARLAMTGKDKG